MAELEAASAEQLFDATPANDNFQVFLKLKIASGIDYTPAAAGPATFAIGPLSPFTALTEDHVGIDPATGDQRLNLFDATTAPLLSDRLNEFLDFNVVGAPETIAVLGHLRTWLERLPNSPLLNAYDIPFADAVLGQDAESMDPAVAEANLGFLGVQLVGGGVFTGKAGIQLQDHPDEEKEWTLRELMRAFAGGLGPAGDAPQVITLLDVVTRPNVELSGDLDFNLEVKPNIAGLNKNNEGATRLGFMDLAGLDARVTLDAEAKALLDLAVGFDPSGLDFIAPLLPNVTAELVFDWGGTLLDGTFSGGIDIDFGSHLEEIAFRNVAIDLGSFLGDVIGPFVAPIQQFTEPFQPIIDIMTAPIPILSDLARKAVTLVDLAAAFGDFDPGFIYAIADIVSLVNSIPAKPGELIIPLPEFVLFDKENGNGAFLLEDLTNPNFSFAAFEDSLFSGLFDDLPDFFDSDFLDGLSDLGDPTTAATTKKLFSRGFDTTGDHGFSFPIFQEPAQIFGLLLGRDAVLIHYDMAPFVMDFEAEMRFPIYGPLWGVVTIGAGMEINLAFGYDTFGIREFVAGDFQNPLDLVGGFFLDVTDPTPELLLSASLFVGAELNLGVASAGAEVGVVFASLFHVHDPNKDGKVRLDELIATFDYEARTGNPVLAPLAIFDITGEISLQLRAFLKILFKKFRFNITSPITLFEFSSDWERQPILASERPDGSLLLNIGPHADKRFHGDTRDIGETIFAEQVGDGRVAVWSEQFGVPRSAAQIYRVTDKIVAFGGEGDDVIDLSGVTVPVEIYGGPGDDTLIGGSGNDLIDGGPGDDRIFGTGGNNILIGGSGNDQIHGGDGDDVIFGDEGLITERMVFVSMGDKDGQDIIYTGLGNNLVFGGGNHDQIFAGSHVDPHDPDADVADVDRAGTGRNVIFGNGGRIALNPHDPHHIASQSNEALLPLITMTNLPNGGNNVIHGGEDNDLIFGGSGSDLVFGHEGDDLVFAESGFDIMFGGPGNDFLDGGPGSDLLFGDNGLVAYFDFSEIPGPLDMAGHGHKLIGDVGLDALDPGDPILKPFDEDTNPGGHDGRSLTYELLLAEVRLGDGDDFIIGGAGNNIIMGGGGDDTIFGDFALFDVIMGNNANIYRMVEIVGESQEFLAFEHDKNRHLEPDPFGIDGRNYNGGNHELIVVRAFELLDYRAGFGDTTAAQRNGGDDLIFGEAGNDVIHGMMGNDVIFGGRAAGDGFSRYARTACRSSPTETTAFSAIWAMIGSSAGPDATTCGAGVATP